MNAFKKQIITIHNRTGRRFGKPFSNAKYKRYQDELLKSDPDSYRDEHPKLPLERSEKSEIPMTYHPPKLPTFAGC